VIVDQEGAPVDRPISGVNPETSWNSMRVQSAVRGVQQAILGRYLEVQLEQQELPT
jgi:hypothetical protein